MWLLIFTATFSILAYQRASLIVWTMSIALLLIFMTQFTGVTIAVIITWLFFLAILILLNLKALRQRYITGPLFKIYQNVLPTMSRTEREAIAAGTVTWEGDLFRGNPDWHKLLAIPQAVLTEEEQAFIDGPVTTLCGMINDWEITHARMDLPPKIWEYIKQQGFFGLIIPKRYGGKEFSAFAHSQILVKISGMSVTTFVSIAVPNSLGPAELLLHYGTDEQKEYYLPRLATGEEIPCFALTSPTAGSDASAMTDHGIVCRQKYNGQETLGIRLNWNKRYITLAPIATVIGLAFKMYDPDHLLGDKEEIGITCALIPRSTPGVEIGRRHFPLDTPFQNGPIKGKDVFIPLDWIIGGPKKAGKGWAMLVECLATGRGITLPASAAGGTQVASYSTGAYARIRKQFNVSIGKFEGIEEPLARIGAFTYIVDAARKFIVGSIDLGEKPAVASAIVKYHTTELARKVGIDVMDIHGGKGICLGPKNYIGRSFESAPIAITVEGANILTRNMIIFGQGAIRCHPYVLAEMEAAKMKDPVEALNAFDKAIIKHIAFGFSNVVRSFFLALTSSKAVVTPNVETKRYFQHMTRFSSAFALIADVSMLTLGSKLKRKESISARLGDILSYLYILSAVLKRYQDEGKNREDLPIVRYAAEWCLFEIQERFKELMRNFPNRWIAAVLKVLIFPFGQWFAKPSDAMHFDVSNLLITTSDSRSRLSKDVYLSPVEGNVMAEIQDALVKSIAAEPIEKIIKEAKHDEKITGYTVLDLARSACEKNIINKHQLDVLIQANEAVAKVIAVDDFSNEELARS